MLSPITGKEMVVKKEWRKMIYRKEAYDVLFHIWHCTDSGENFEDDKFANLNYEQVVNQYRENHNIPFPEDIKAIRNQYKLPASRMSQVLGLGDNTYRQYEAGEMPTLANARLIQMAADPRKFIDLMQLSDLQNEKQFSLVNSNAKKIIDKETCQENFIYKLFNYSFRKFNFTKFALPKSFIDLFIILFKISIFS